ncbi:MAG TPA: pitrilysin family protein [Kofleriaceae bacterium]|nr:pitrilysin family protein [Kofleriaceae bacterium]
MAALLAAASPAHAQPKAAASAARGPNIKTWKLGNGLTVALVERPAAPAVTVQVWYRFGSRDEPAGQRGAARALERLMFEGSDKVRPDQHRKLIEKIGGDSTSLTTEDVTAFHNAVPRQYLDFALELEAERMRGLVFRPEAVARVVAVLSEEARKQEASPLYRAYLMITASAFSGQPYAWSPAGVRGEIERLTADKLKALYDAYYRPSNALVVVVGGAGAGEVEKAVEKRFGRLAKGGPPARQPIDPATRADGPHRTEMPGGQVGLAFTGFRLPQGKSADMPALQIIGSLLTGGPSSRLHRRLVGGKLADEIGGQVLVREGPGLLVAYARVAAQAEPAAVEKAILAEVDKLAAQGPTPAELRRARGQVLGSAWFGMESTTGVANQIGVSWTLTGMPDAFVADLARLEKVNAAAVKKAAAAYLGSKRAHVVVAPASSGRAGGGR